MENRRIIVVDFDDTIFPSCLLKLLHNDRKTATTVLFDDKFDLNRLPELKTKLQHPHIISLDLTICSFFQQLIDDSDNQLYLVTNAQSGWIQRTTRTFLPLFHYFLTFYCDRVRVMSARDLYESVVHKDPTMWKILCFDNIIDKEDHNHKGKVYDQVHFLSIGDGEAEFDATKLIETKHHPDQVVFKIVKMLESPSVKTLIAQWQKINSELPTLLYCDHRLEIKFAERKVADAS